MSDVSPKVKKRRIDECINSVKDKMVSKNQQEEEVGDILSLINLGAYMKMSSDDREYRKERGDRLLQLFWEQPALSNSASARKLEKNHERALIWDEITNKINEEFGEKLEFLTVDKVKKLLTYYKKKDEGNLEKPGNKEVMIKLEDVPEPANILSDVDQPLANLLSIISKTPTSSSTSSSSSSGFLPLLVSPNSSSSSNSPSSETMSISGEQFYILKKQRHDFVVNLAEHYIQRMCFDNSSRSATVNAERHNMWIKITQETNDRFSKILGHLGVEQSKKLYSNCKRRRRIKESEQPSCSSTASPDPDDFLIENDDSSPMQLLDTIMAEMTKDAEIAHLKMELVKRDCEISALKATIEKSEKHKTKILELIDDLREKVVDVVH